MSYNAPLWESVKELCEENAEMEEENAKLKLRLRSEELTREVLLYELWRAVDHGLNLDAWPELRKYLSEKGTV